VLDSLRQPLETGDVLIARANFHVRYPARFQLIAAMNPCICGYGRSSGRACGRGANCEEIYQARISGPFLDRMDLAVSLPAVSPHDLTGPNTGETSTQIAARISNARMMQLERNIDPANTIITTSDNTKKVLPAEGTTNAAFSDSLLSRLAKPDPQGAELMSRAVDALALSARGYHRVLRVARTLADLDGNEGVQRRHIAEAISYRQKATQTDGPTGNSLSVNADIMRHGHT